MTLIIFLLIIQFSFSNFQPYSGSNEYANTSSIAKTKNESCYARILFDQVNLFKTASSNSDYSNIYFELPKTYFVKLTDAEGEFYKAEYMGTIGYVKKDCVQAVKNTPINPFLTNISFRVYAELSQQLRSSPTAYSSSNLITTIPNLTRNITFIGKIQGDCLIEGRTSTWFYCKFSSNQDFYGYVYSDFCDEMPPIYENFEEVEYINNPTFEIEAEPTNSIPITSNSVGIIIAILSLPALAFIFLVLKSSKILSQTKQRGKEVTDY